MGCCFSKATPQNPITKHALKIQQRHEAAPPPPPPPPMEEESVKEVLSETPISKPHQVPVFIAETKTQMPSVQNPVEKFETKSPKEEVLEVVSQVSEVCSISESFSTATTATTATVTEKREDEVTSKQSNREGTLMHKRNSSPSRKRPYVSDGNFAGGRERKVKSPARRPDPSPDKKVKGGSRLARGRESGPVANRRFNAGPAGVRRDSGEGSGRRSRSPSCTRTVGGASKVSAGGDRRQMPLANGVEKEKKSESNKVSGGGDRKQSAAANGVEKEKKSESEEVSEVSEGGEKNDVVSHEECLENPHVSMECFIFL